MLARRILVLLLAVVIIGFVAIQFPPLQDTLIKRGATAQLQDSVAFDKDALKVVVCGSASPLGNNPDRAQACVAVLTPEHFIVFDIGRGSSQRLGAARLPLDRLQAVYLTHFHSDHIADLPDVNLNSWVAGRPESLIVAGPEGIRQVVAGLNQAYELDRGYRVTHHSAELLPPAVGLMTVRQLAIDEVVEMDELTITQFEVTHDPVSPSVGFRVDYKGRSVVISGDSIATDSLARHSQGVDLLLHDALAMEALDLMIAGADAADRPRLRQIMEDVKDYHAEVGSVEALADKAGVKQLVLYHLVPSPANALMESVFERAMQPDTILAEDLMTFVLPVGTDEIEVLMP